MNHKFNLSRSNKEALFFAKMAIIELCGWIEESMDDIILRCAIRNLKESSNINFIKNKVVNRTYGFRYNKHFRKMIISVIGLIAYEKLEKSIDQTKFDGLRTELRNLATRRNEEAHTHIKITRNINAPSLTLAQFRIIYDGLIEIDHKLRSMNNLR
jgi:hypothetical protein